MKLKKLLVVVLAFAMLFVTGCGGGGGESGGDTGAKDSLIIGIEADPDSLDPYSVSEWIPMTILTNVYEPLVRMDYDSKIVPALATEWKISDDGTEYEFTIRTDATFHNGDPITAEDVKYSLELAASSDYTGPYMNVIDHVDVIDESHVNVVLKYAYAPFLALCTSYSQVVKEDFYAEDSGVDMAKAPIGSGPYKFVSWDQGDKLEFEAYDGFYGGEPSIKHLTYKTIQSSTTQAIALETGDVDMLLTVATADIAAMEEKDNITVIQKPSSTFYLVCLNTNSEKLSDVRVRQAIAKCINKENLIEGAQNGYGVPTNSFIAEGLPGYDPDFDPLPYDVDAAKQLMKEAGYPDGFELSMSITENRSTEAQMLKADLAQIGIDLTIDIIEAGKYWDDLENQNYEMTMFGWYYMVMDPDVGYYSLYKSDDLVNNHTGFGTKEIDDLLEAGRTSSDEKERAEIYAELEEKVMSQAPYVPLFWSITAIAFNSNLTNVDIPPAELHYVYNYEWK